MISCNIKGAFFVFKEGRGGKKVLVEDISKEFKDNKDSIDVHILFHMPESREIKVDGCNYTFFNIEREYL